MMQKSLPLLSSPGCNGKELEYNLLVAINDMCSDAPVNSASTTIRNDPNWYARDLVSRAKEIKV